MIFYRLGSSYDLLRRDVNEARAPVHYFFHLSHRGSNAESGDFLLKYDCNWLLFLRFLPDSFWSCIVVHKGKTWSFVWAIKIDSFDVFFKTPCLSGGAAGNKQ